MPSAGDIVNAIDVQIDGVQLGVVGIVTTASAGTATSGVTETRDAVLGSVVFTVAAAQAATRYRVTLSGRGLNCSATPSRYTINFRDGGASTPTAVSTLVGVNFNVVPSVAAGTGIMASTYSSTYVPGAGTHTVGVFVVQNSGSGTATPSGACELYVEALG